MFTLIAYLGRSWLLALICLLGIQAYSQTAEEWYAKGKAEYRKGDKHEGSQSLAAAARLAQGKAMYQYDAGIAALETRQSRQAYKFLKVAYELDPTIDRHIVFDLASAAHKTELFDEAKMLYESYLLQHTKYGKRTGDRYLIEEVKLRIKQCEYAKEAMYAPLPFQVTSLGSTINSVYPDYAPVISVDGKVMAFTSRRKGGTGKGKALNNEYFEDIYFSKKTEEGNWSTASNPGPPLNSAKHEGTLHLSELGKVLYLYKPNSMGDFYMSEQNDQGDWSEPEHVFPEVQSDVSETSLAIPSHQKFMIFSSNRGGGFGDLDLYISYKDEKGAWLAPINFGPKINTAMDEDAPHLSPDGNILYFSSKGRVGLGGYDVYKSEYDPQNRTWSEPVNVGYPINTVDDDIFFVPLDNEGKQALCASVRDNGIGDVDIFMINEIPESERVPAELVAKGTPSTSQSGDASPQVETREDDVQMGMKATNPRDNNKPAMEEKESVIVQIEVSKPLQGTYAAPPVVKMQHKASGTVYNVPISDEKGTYEVQLPKNQKGAYVLTVEQDGHLFESRTISPTIDAGGKTIIRERIDLKPATIGSSLVLRNIYFDFNQSKLKDDSYSEIIKVERLLREDPSITLEIAGHTDNIGSKGYNRKLSLKRANAVVGHLVAKGISSNRLVAKGHGFDKPLASNDDETEGREINRRIEFIVTGVKR